MTLHDEVRRRLLDGLAGEGAADARRLDEALRLLAKWRSALVQNTILRRHGTVVMEGPLQGLDYLSRSAEGCHVAKLLGCYEQPLHPFIESAIRAAYPVVLNIGCAEGYYAVGMARRMPATRVEAFDADAQAQRACAALAARNGVADRVQVGARFRPEDFARYAGRKALVLCDTEGAEKDLLDPERAPALTGMDIIVESHDCLIRGLSRLLVERFRASHDVTVVPDDGLRRLRNAPAWFHRLAHLDQLLATWEWRVGPTPWLVMKARQDG